MSIMTPAPNTPTTPLRRWTPSELRLLPAAERSAILAPAAELAADDYANDPSLTDFDAFGKDDLYRSGSDSEPR